MASDTTSTHFITRDRRFARGAALVVVAIGALVMVGWAFDITLFKSILPGYATMKFNTALGFVATGAALYTLRTYPRLSGGLALIAMLIGLLTFMQYLFGWNFGIDELIIRDSTTVVTLYPGRMAPVTAANLSLVGGALLAIYARRYLFGQMLALVVAFLALLAVAGYLYGVEALYRISTFSSMAVHTAITFIIAGQGILAAYSDRGILRIVTSDSAGGTVLRRLVPAVIVVPLLVGWLRLQGELLGFYDARFGLALFALSNIIIFFTLILWLAWVLHGIDIEREKGVEALQRSRDELEEKVLERTVSLEETTRSLGAEIFERNRVEKEIQEQRQLLRLLLDNLPQKIFVKDAASRFVIVNQATLAEFGVTSEAEVIGKTDFEFHARDKAEAFHADEAAILASGQPRLNYEESIFDRTRQAARWYSTSKIPLRADDGKVTGLVGINYDITETKATEAALTALHEITIELTNIDDLDTFYKRAVELGLERLGFDRVGLLLYDAETTTATGTYGTDTGGSVVPEHHLRLKPTDLTSILMRALQQDTRFAVDEHAELFSNLEPIGTGWNAVAVLWHGAETLGWLAIDNGARHTPMTKLALNMLALYALTLGTLLAQKRVEDQLRRQEELYRVLVTHLPKSAVILYDPELRFLLANGAALVENGYDQSAMVGRTLFEVLPAERAAALEPYYRRALSGESFAFEWETPKSNYYLIQMVPVTNTGGAIFAGMMLLQDITERRHAEEQRLQFEVQNEKVLLLNRFMMDASHDLRTPITVMKTSLSLVKRLPDSEKRDLWVARLGEGLEQLHTLVENLFTLVRLDMSASEFELKPGDLNVLVEIVGMERGELAGQRKQTLKLTLEPNLPKVLLNLTEFVPALSNLVTNALNYSPEGGEISIETRRQDDHIEVSVRDNGIGISDDNLPHIFDRFFRVDKARGTGTGGSGVGLTIAQKIVQAHGGEIQVESTLGAGSLFKIVLPIPPVNGSGTHPSNGSGNRLTP